MEMSKQELKSHRSMYEKSYDATHHLKKIDEVVDWTFIRKSLRRYYSQDQGRPSYDPLILVKILFIQVVEGFRSVRMTCRQVDQHYTYRWFLGLRVDQAAPKHSTISYFLNHRLDGIVFWRNLFNMILLLIKKKGYLANETWAADETEIKANANKRNREVAYILKQKPNTNKHLDIINTARSKLNRKKLSPSTVKYEVQKYYVSPVDPDARLSVKHEIHGQFAYFEHRIVDTLHRFIIATTVTGANVPGHRILMSQLKAVENCLDLKPLEIVLDAGYYNADLIRELVHSNITPYISYKRFKNNQHPKCKNAHFKQINDSLYVCRQGIPFYHVNTTRQGYHIYQPPKGSCQNCPYQQKADEDRLLRISIHQPYYDIARNNRLSPRGKQLKPVRSSTIELSFANSKELHGMRYARYRGALKVMRQVLTTAIVQNLLRFANLESAKKMGWFLTYEPIIKKFEEFE